VNHTNDGHLLRRLCTGGDLIESQLTAVSRAVIHAAHLESEGARSQNDSRHTLAEELTAQN
jgi:hypothetical protein